MYPVYPVIFFLAYLLLFLLVPTVWALGGAWRRARSPRAVVCPGSRSTETVNFDPWFAVRRHAAGEDTELRIARCTRWPGEQGCGRGCV